VRRLCLVLAVGVSVTMAACSAEAAQMSPDSPHAAPASWSWLGTENTATNGGQIAAVSCSSSMLCVAVGFYNPFTDKGNLAASFDGRRWSQAGRRFLFDSAMDSLPV